MKFDWSNPVEALRRRAGPMWQAALDYAAGRAGPPEKPFEVGVHLYESGQPGCRHRCIDCCGRYMRGGDGRPAADWLRLYAELTEMEVPSVTLSGNHTDPDCASPELFTRLVRLGGPRWGIKLHTFGAGLTDEAEDAILEAASRDPRCDSYVTFSRPATQPRVYRRLCRPSGDPAELLTRQAARIASMAQIADDHWIPLSITVNCRLTQLNADDLSLGGLLTWAFNGLPDNVRLRFTTDYAPTGASRRTLRRFENRLWLSPTEAAEAVMSALDAIAATDAERARVSLRMPTPAPARRPGRCLVRLLFGAVGADGRFYPCQGVAGKPFRHLAFGRLGTDGFADAWHRYVATVGSAGTDPVTQGCPACDADWARQVSVALEEGAR